MPRRTVSETRCGQTAKESASELFPYFRQPRLPPRIGRRRRRGRRTQNQPAAEGGRREVRVAAKHLNAELSALAAENKILWLAEEFRAEHIRTVFLIIAASSDQALNRRVFHLAESCQKPVNVVDDRDHCSFIFPSVIDRNPVQIAVSSSGSAPVLARLLRERLEALLPPSLGDMAEISGRWRDAVKGKLKSVTERRRFWEKQFNGRFAALVKTQQNTLAERELAKQLEQNYQGGFVSLVGAGPGDAGLLTLKGLQEIQQADVVLYDALVSDGILSSSAAMRNGFLSASAPGAAAPRKRTPMRLWSGWPAKAGAWCV